MKRFIRIVPILIFLCFGSIVCDNQEESQNINSIQRFAELIKVKPEFEERYIILHKYTFPGVLDRIYKSNLRNYSIFLKEGLLFAYYEYIGDDFKADMAKIEQDSTTQEWWKLTKPMLEMLESRKQGEWWASMEKVLHMDIKQIPSTKAKRYAYTIDLPLSNQEKFRNILDGFDTEFKKLLEEAKIQNISLYLKDGRLYCYLEYAGKNFKSDMQKLVKTSEYENWKRLSEPLLQKIPTAKPDEWWSEAEEVFHTD